MTCLLETFQAHHSTSPRSSLVADSGADKFRLFVLEYHPLVSTTPSYLAESIRQTATILGHTRLHSSNIIMLVHCFTHTAISLSWVTVLPLHRRETVCHYLFRLYPHSPPELKTFLCRSSFGDDRVALCTTISTHKRTSCCCLFVCCCSMYL